MQFLIIWATLTAIIEGGYVPHDGGHGSAYSYQNIHMEHYHAVPTYIKKEDMHFLQHPLPIGDSSSSVSIHHGTKQQPAYASVSTENDVHPAFYNTDVKNDHKESPNSPNLNYNQMEDMNMQPNQIPQSAGFSNEFDNIAYGDDGPSNNDDRENSQEYASNGNEYNNNQEDSSNNEEYSSNDQDDSSHGYSQENNQYNDQVNKNNEYESNQDQNHDYHHQDSQQEYENNRDESGAHEEQHQDYNSHQDREDGYNNQEQQNNNYHQNIPSDTHQIQQFQVPHDSALQFAVLANQVLNPHNNMYHRYYRHT